MVVTFPTWLNMHRSHTKLAGPSMLVYVCYVFPSYFWVLEWTKEGSNFVQLDIGCPYTVRFPHKRVNVGELCSRTFRNPLHCKKIGLNLPAYGFYSAHLMISSERSRCWMNEAEVPLHPEMLDRWCKRRKQNLKRELMKKSWREIQNQQLRCSRTLPKTNVKNPLIIV